MAESDPQEHAWHDLCSCADPESFVRGGPTMTLLYPIIFPITVNFEIFEFIVKHFLFYE